MWWTLARIRRRIQLTALHHVAAFCIDLAFPDKNWDAADRVARTKAPSSHQHRSSRLALGVRCRFVTIPGASGCLQDWAPLQGGFHPQAASWAICVAVPLGMLPVLEAIRCHDAAAACPHYAAAAAAVAAAGRDLPLALVAVMFAAVAAAGAAAADAAAGRDSPLDLVAVMCAADEYP